MQATESQSCPLQPPISPPPHHHPPPHLVLVRVAGHGHGLVGQLVVTCPAGVNGEGVWPHPLLPRDDGVKKPGGVGGVADGELTPLPPTHTGREVEALGEGGWRQHAGSNLSTADGVSVYIQYTAHTLYTSGLHHTTPHPLNCTHLFDWSLLDAHSCEC